MDIDRLLVCIVSFIFTIGIITLLHDIIGTIRFILRNIFDNRKSNSKMKIKTKNEKQKGKIE